MTALLLLPPAVLTPLALLLVVVIVSLVAWALQLMQAATDRQEFSLMLAGCMVCSAAVGLATVMVITFTSPARLDAQGLALLQAAAGAAVELPSL
ncbi:MAG: hypothetical protein FJ050_08520 [Cyanobacteria bacterium M_surface_7_m2_040]|nr:hypothetical protein [Cyanobacteria bacterium M_surface_7_m2_040]